MRYTGSSLIRYRWTAVTYRTDQFPTGSRRTVVRGTVKTQRIESCAMSLELPPLVRSGVFIVFFFS